MNAGRCFPPPWTVEDIDAAFVVKDHSGQKLAYVYYEDEPDACALGCEGIASKRLGSPYCSDRPARLGEVKNPKAPKARQAAFKGPVDNFP